MNKLLQRACLAIICMGMVQSLYRAANDYGLREINLCDAITAQANNTSNCGPGGHTTTVGNITYYTESYLRTRTETKKEKTDSNGKVTVWDTTYYLMPNTVYTFTAIVKECNAFPEGVCISNEQKTEILDLNKGDNSTNGDQTSHP